ANLHARQGLADGSGQHPILRTRDRQHRRRLSETVTFEDRKTESLKISLHLLVQRGSAADEITNAAAHAFMDRIEQDVPEIQRRLVPQPGIEFAYQVSVFRNQLAVVVKPVLDAAMQ